ncbi:hypothetical protein EJB05_28251, partial [Eragrostis curvula]
YRLLHHLLVVLESALCRIARCWWTSGAPRTGRRGMRLANSASHHGGEEINTFEAFALSHKGKATADIHYNPEDPP